MQYLYSNESDECWNLLSLFCVCYGSFRTPTNTQCLTRCSLFGMGLALSRFFSYEVAVTNQRFIQISTLYYYWVLGSGGYRESVTWGLTCRGLLWACLVGGFRWGELSYSIHID